MQAEITFRQKSPTSPIQGQSPQVLEPGVSSVSHGLTPSNSYLIAWQNACVERSATNRVNAAIELFPSGACSVRFDTVETTYPAPIPPDFHGHDQDADWIRATFPDEADAILAQGYDDWLLNDYVGINAENGHALIRVTIDPSAFNQAPSTTNHQPTTNLPRVRTLPRQCRRAFPLEVLTSCEVRTYPTPIPLAFDFDDGYRGDNGNPIGLPTWINHEFTPTANAEFATITNAMSHTMTMTEFQDTQRVRRMCVGNADPIFISGEDGEAQMVVLDAGIFRELYAKHQIYKKLEESERDFAEGHHQDAYEMLTDVFSSAHV